MNQLEFNQQFAIYDNCEERRNRAFALYLNSRANRNNFCLLGRNDAIETIIGHIIGELAPEQILLVTDGNAANFYTTNDIQNGNVLRANFWSLAVNDAWVIGGINGGSTFNFVGTAALSLLDFNEIYLRGSAQYPITVTAREILGLMGAGYTPNVLNGALVFTPSAGRDLTTFDFVEYDEVINRYANADERLSAIFAYLEPAFQQLGG
ncbi:MAG: hypothetical protein LBC70_07935 [Chitinispirillales bacterium]|nr:hypothetical protein [Chitinispirillales bacterium]